MPLDRLVSLILAVVALAGVTVFAAAAFGALGPAVDMGLGTWAAGGLVPVALLAALVARVWLSQAARRGTVPRGDRADDTR
jgi:hypothetical protein